jgi:heptosyltransferase-2
MNVDSLERVEATDAVASADRPTLIVPYMWIGDFVRCHSVVRILRERFAGRPVDMLATTLCAPLVDYMPGVRRAVVVDLPRKRLAFDQHRALAERLKKEGYGSALVMPKTWKSALAPFLAGIPQRTGLFGEVRFGLLNDLRFGKRKLPRMVDECTSLALPRGARRPAEWPAPELRVPAGEMAAWRQKRGLTGQSRPALALAPGAVGPSKRWPAAAYASVARRLAADGFAVWVLGGPAEKPLAQEIAAGSGASDLTGPDLREAILALACAAAALSNDSGLLHIAAAMDVPAIGIFGPTSPWHWAPLNALAAIVQADNALSCRPCHKPVCRFGHHRCMAEISPDEVLSVARRALAGVRPAALQEPRLR